MRIPLDYYRILGISIQADAQQLSQAYHDRALQLPRREYSDLAINTRKQLLDEAYTILSDGERRAEYDQTFLNTAPPDVTGSTTGPTLDIHPEQLVGALLLLYELGEYELVLPLSEPLLRSAAVLVPEQMQLVNNPLTRADIVLTVALSCLELGREQWQQGQSDAAAQTGHYGQELLLREGLFPGIRGELQTDMYKLRPYRILELVTQEESAAEHRQKGIQLLQDMLAERGGIEGTGDDQSGLSLDDFLRFIQQIRNHLTTLEQQELFTREAERPSAVGMYLLIYAEIAHGFAYCQPQAIAQAQKRLKRLGQHQDVYLEQAVCALLLGQTGAASRALERSQEYEPLAFIREQSQDAPDLLPGLCLYGERWLQTEVFPHFRDLTDQTLDLKDYFANEEVQGHLEQLATGQRTAATSAPKVSMPVVSSPPVMTPEAIAPQETELVESPVAVAEPPVAPSPVPSPPEESTTEPRMPQPFGAEDTVGEEETDDLPIARRSRARADRRASIQNTRLILIGIGGLIAVLGIGFFITQIAQLVAPRPEDPPETAVETEIPGEETVPLEISLDQPAVAIPTTAASSVDPTSEPEPVTATEDPLDEVLAQEIVQTWLAVKSIALGPEYEINEFATILTEPALSTWQQLANSHKADNTYRNYEHALEIETITTDGNNPDSALIEAAVREEATAYRNGQPDAGGSYDENLRVRYELVRQGDQWLIKDMQVLQ